MSTENTPPLPSKGKPPSIKALVELGYSRKPESKWPVYNGGEQDRTAYMTASEAGKCERSIWFGKHERFFPKVEAENTSWGFWERGHNVEAWVVEQLERSGLTCMFTGDNQRSFVVDMQSGTPDGLVKWEGQWYCLEIKSIDPRTNVKNLPKKENVVQTQQNMDLMNFCLQDQGIEVIASLLFYVNASDYRQSYDFVVYRDTEEGIRLEEKAHKIMTSSLPEELIPEGLYNGGCGYCEFTAHCSDVVQAKKDMTVKQAKMKVLADNLFKS